MTIAKKGDSNALLMYNYHRQTDWAKHSLQASSPIGGVARGHAKEDVSTKRELATTSNKFSFPSRKPQETAKR